MPTYILAIPPPTNNLYFNRKNGGRGRTPRYNAWISGEMKALLAQRAKPVPTPVAITITLPMTMRGDLDGRTKAPLDLLVKAGIIPDDAGKYIRSLTMTFGDVQMMRVQIETMGRAA